MKKLIFTITALVLCIALLGGCGKAGVLNNATSSNTAGRTEEAPSLIASKESAADMPAELLALRFDDYENMSISEYQEKANSIISKSEAEYLSLIEHVNADSGIQNIRFTNDDAYFVTNILIPTIAEKWSAWSINASATNETGLAEYTISYSILNADNVTMGKRNQAIAEIMEGIQNVLDSRTPAQLLAEAETQTALDTKIKEIEERFNDDSFHIEATFSYRADAIASSALFNDKGDLENRSDIGTKADYQLLLSLKTDEYKNMSVADFLKSYTELAQKADFQEVCTKVLRDIACNDVRMIITDDELDFLKTTLEATSQEFVAKYQSKYELPTLWYRIEKQQNKFLNGQNVIVFELFIDCSIDYSVVDEDKLTIGERDNALTSVKKGMQDFIDSRTENELIDGSSELEAEIKKLEGQYSNSKIQINIDIISYQANDQNKDTKVLQ